MSDDAAITYDESVVGQEVEVGSHTFTREQIANYSSVVGETNPLYTDDAAAKTGPYGEVVAPTGMLQTMHTGFGPDPKLQVPFKSASFHAGQKMEFFAPIRVGDTITVWAQVKEIYEKTGRSGRMVFVVNRLTYRNQRQEPVAAMEHSFVHREIKALED